MTTQGDFIKLQKIDYCSRLDVGMRFSSYVAWAGFYIPQMNAKEIEYYSKIRIKTEKDVQSLFALSLNEAGGDNVKVIEGTVSTELSSYFQNPASFVSAVKGSVEKYSSRLLLKPYIGVNSDTASCMGLARSFFAGGIFAGLDAGGQALAENPEYFADAFAEAHEAGLKIKIDVSQVKDRGMLEKLLHVASPDFIRGAGDFNLLIQSASLLAGKTAVCLTPSECAKDLKGAASSAASLLDRGVTVRLGSSDILYQNKTLSEFASDLCNTGLISKETVTSLFS